MMVDSAENDSQPDHMRICPDLVIKHVLPGNTKSFALERYISGGRESCTTILLDSIRLTS